MTTWTTTICAISPFSSSHELVTLSENAVMVQTNVAGCPSMMILVGLVISMVGGGTAHNIPP